MFRSKKAIPGVAAAMIALTGCGDSADGAQDGAGGAGGTGGGAGAAGLGGAGGAGGSAGGGGGADKDVVAATDSGGDLVGAIEAFCMQQFECGQLVEVYDCLDAHFSTPIVGLAEGPCLRALASYFDCITSLGCELVHRCENEGIVEFLGAACELSDD